MGERRVPVGVALKGFSSLSLCQIQTLMARAEYLKDQMKVGLLTGGGALEHAGAGWKTIFCPGRCGRRSPWARRRWQSPSAAVSPFFCPLLSHQRGFGERGLGKRPTSWLRSLW